MNKAWNYKKNTGVFITPVFWCNYILLHVITMTLPSCSTVKFTTVLFEEKAATAVTASWGVIDKE